LGACGVVATQPADIPTPANIDPTQTPIAIITPTPTLTVIGTWETTIEGVLFDGSVGKKKPIPDATITYDVLHSYFRGLQEGRLNQTQSDENGEFSLTVMVHDTDNVRILIEAQGFTKFEEKYTGFDLVVGKKLEIGLEPE